MAKAEGVERVVYLGGLGDEPGSEHLRSRHETAEVLQEHGPPLTYFRAAMVVGAKSESFRTLRYLVERLPAMIAPSWLKTPTQPIGIDDVVAYLAAAPDTPESKGREIQIGGPDILSYGDMLDSMARALGKRPRPKVPVPFITPWLSSLWIGLVTPVDAGRRASPDRGPLDAHERHRPLGCRAVRRRAHAARRDARARARRGAARASPRRPCSSAPRGRSSASRSTPRPTCRASVA